MITSLTPEILESLKPFIYLDDTDSKDIILWCPFCDDRKQHDHAHLYLDRVTAKWHCFYCDKGFSDGLDPLLRAFGLQVSYIEQLQHSVLLHGTPKINLEYFRHDRNSKDVEDQIKDIQANHIPIKPDSIAFKYLNGRGLTEDQILSNWVLWPSKPGFAFWVYPSINRVEFFSGRKYNRFVAGEKYYNIQGKKPIILFNADRPFYTPTGSGKRLLFLVEGLFDALATPGMALPLFGKTIPRDKKKELLDLIRREQFSPVCAVDSSELFKDAQKIVKTLHEASIEEIYLFDMRPSKDFGEGAFKDADYQTVCSRLTEYIPFGLSQFKLSLE